jgi:uncharacterized protein (TIGR03905 family)
MRIKVKPQGVCAREIQFDLEDGIVKNITFIGGCSGNTQGVSALANGMSADEIVKKLSNIKCGFKNTSCPAQLAKAVKTAIEK